MSLVGPVEAGQVEAEEVGDEVGAKHLLIRVETREEQHDGWPAHGNAPGYYAACRADEPGPQAFSPYHPPVTPD